MVKQQWFKNKLEDAIHCLNSHDSSTFRDANNLLAEIYTYEDSGGVIAFDEKRLVTLLESEVAIIERDMNR